MPHRGILVLQFRSCSFTSSERVNCYDIKAYTDILHSVKLDRSSMNEAYVVEHSDTDPHD